MPDNNPVTKAPQVTVTTIEDGNREGTSSVTVSGIGQYPTTLGNVFNSLLEGVAVGGTYTFHLERGNRKQNYVGKEGDQDWMYFQNLRRVGNDSNGSAPAPAPTQAQPTQDNVVYGTPQHDQYYMRDARIMYQNMFGNISTLASRYEWDGAMTLDEIADQVAKSADRMFNLKYKPILDGQLPLEPEPEPEEDDPF